MNRLQKWAQDYIARNPMLTVEQALVAGYKAGQRGEAEEAPETTAATRLDCKAVVAMYNNTCKNFRRVVTLSANRREKVRCRIEEMSRLGDPLAVLEQVLNKMQDSPFLCGHNQRGWMADFDWLMKNGDNWVKVYEGRYDGGVASVSGKSVNDFWD